LLKFLSHCLIGVIFFAAGTVHAQLTENDRQLYATYENGEQIPYILTTVNLQTPRYALILQPGGNGSMYNYGNFLIRSRNIFADYQTVVADTDATRSPERMRGIVYALTAQYPGIKVYVIGTSNGTFSTMALGQDMDGEVAGFIHTSSLSAIGRYDTRGLKSRHLIVHHELDACRVTPYESAKANHEKFGTEFISVTGGESYGDACLAQSYHGYKNIEAQVVNQIKAWVQSAP